MMQFCFDVKDYGSPKVVAAKLRAIADEWDPPTERVEFKEPETVAIPHVEAIPLPTQEDVFDAFKKFAKAQGLPKAKEILAHFKVKSVQDIAENDYPEVLVKLGSN